MLDELYADGVGEITVTGSIVRINLMSLSATEKDGKNDPKAVFRQRIIMPIDGFANTVDLMQKALAGLVEAGAIRRVTETTGAPVVRAEFARDSVDAVMAPPRLPNASPNFN